MCDLCLVTIGVPAFGALGSELRIFEPWVVQRIAQRLHVVTGDSKSTRMVGNGSPVKRQAEEKCKEAKGKVHVGAIWYPAGGAKFIRKIRKICQSGTFPTGK